MSEVDTRYSESNIPPSRLQSFISLENLVLHRRPEEESLSAGYSFLKTLYSTDFFLNRDPAITSRNKRVFVEWAAPKLKYFVSVDIYDKDKFVCSSRDTKTYEDVEEILGTYDEVIEFLRGKVGS